MSGIVFGKLPAHGDFVARGLRSDERDALDAWLSAALIAARETWGNAFDDRYDHALPMRYEGEAVSGTLAASQDAAGRRYPVLALGATGEGERIESLLYDAIADGWDADRLADAIGAPPGGVPPFRGSERWYRDGGPMLSGEAPGDLLVEMLR